MLWLRMTRFFWLKISPSWQEMRLGVCTIFVTSGDCEAEFRKLCQNQKCYLRKRYPLLSHWKDYMGFPGGASIEAQKNPPANAEDIKDVCSIPGLGRFLTGRHGSPLQYSCLESPMDKGARWAMVYRVVKEMVKNLPAMQETWVWYLGRNTL